VKTVATLIPAAPVEARRFCAVLPSLTLVEFVGSGRSRSAVLRVDVVRGPRIAPWAGRYPSVPGGDPR